MARHSIYVLAFYAVVITDSVVYHVTLPDCWNFRFGNSQCNLEKTNRQTSIDKNGTEKKTLRYFNLVTSSNC